MKGKLIIFSAPSGSGKTSIVREVMHKLSLHFSVSATTRSPRGNEIHGKDYLFLSLEEFQEKIQEDAFLEYEEVYPGKYYGTLKSEVDQELAKGYNLVFDVDVVGGLAIKKAYQEQALALFIQAPSIEELEQRLIKRGTDHPEMIQERVNKAGIEMSYADQFDEIIINEDLATAVRTTEQIIMNFINH